MQLIRIKTLKSVKKRNPDKWLQTGLQGSWEQIKAEENLQWKQQTSSKIHYLSLCMPLSATRTGNNKQLQLAFGTELQTDKAKYQKKLD